jgi:hypothetical protein
VDGVQRLFVVGGNRDSRSARRFLEVPLKLILEPGHGCRVRNSRAVNQHRNIEIPVGEHLNDVVEVSPDLIAALGVLHVVGANIDRAAVVMQFKMMGGLLMKNTATGRITVQTNTNIIR